MTEKEEEGPEFSIDLGFGNIFKGLGNFVDLLSKMAEEDKGELSRTGEIKGLKGGVRGLYGVSVRVGLGGVPTVEAFGNIRETEQGPVVEEVREPMVDIFEEEDRVLIIAELPGVDEGSIKLEGKGDILVIQAEQGERKYGKEVLLPSGADPSRLTHSYKNGVLEISVPRAGKREQ